MIYTVSTIALSVVSLCMLVAAYRVVRGPTTADRVVALDNIATNLIAVILLASIHEATLLYADAALIIAVLAFVATVALAKYIVRGVIIERDPH